MGLPRLNSSDVLFVPPYECAWLSGVHFQLQANGGCVVFEARGGHDATVILRDQPGTKRLEQTLPEGSPARSYMVKFGSHQNSILELERNGTAVSSEKSSAAAMDSLNFMQFWVNFRDGTLTVGKNEPAIQNVMHEWTDVRPGAGICHVGLSSWDSCIAYRNIHVKPPVDLVPSPADVCAPAMPRGAVSYAAEHFTEVLREDPAGLCSLPVGTFCQVAQDEALGASELELFHTAVDRKNCRAEFQEGAGDEDFDEVLQCVRFPLMRAFELTAVREHPIAQKSKALQDLLSEVDMTSKLGALRKGVDLELEGRYLSRRTDDSARAARRRHRRHAKNLRGASHDLIYAWDGDEYGLCSYMGTAQGTQSFINPCIEKRLRVTCSGPPAKHCNPNLIMSRKFVNVLFAGPQYVDGAITSWWSVELAGEERLAVNYYTIRHDGSNNYPRNWVLQGSGDHGASWELLSEHVNDETIASPGQFGSWPVATAGAFNAFRLVRTGPNASLNSAESRHFHLSMLEFYGTLYVDPAV